MRQAGGMPVAAVLLTGGRGSRLGGVDKGALRLEGSTLLERALDALAGLPTVIVGPRRAAADRPAVLVVREDPPLSGPAAAVAAGLAAVPADADRVLLLAVDVVGLPAVVPLLLAADPGPDGVVAVDPEGREQWLLALVRRPALEASAAALGDPAGASLRVLLGGLRLARLPLPPGLHADVDTVDDARAAGAGLPGQEEERG